jgi:ATP-dependent RNA helicase DDX27
MYREKGGTGEIRVLILVPTRELAVQCADVSKALARFMDVSFGVIVGTHISFPTLCPVLICHLV